MGAVRTRPPSIRSHLDGPPEHERVGSAGVRQKTLRCSKQLGSLVVGVHATLEVHISRPITAPGEEVDLIVKTRKPNYLTRVREQIQEQTAS